MVWNNNGTNVDARNDIAKRKEIAQIIMLGEFNKGEKSEGQKHVDLLQEAYPLGKAQSYHSLSLG